MVMFQRENLDKQKTPNPTTASPSTQIYLFQIQRRVHTPTAVCQTGNCSGKGVYIDAVI